MSGALAAAFRENFAHRSEIGAAVCVWRDGHEVASLCGGAISKGPDAPAWRTETLVPIWSTTKSPAAATVLWALDHVGLELSSPVRRIWPELRADVTFAQLLSHQAGLAALDTPVSVWDREAVVRALESQEPNWPPGNGHGYHPRTAGFLWDECVRRLCTGTSLGELWRQTIAIPLDLDIWIGLPPGEFHRVATVYAGSTKPRPQEADFARAFGNPGSLTHRAFASPHGLNRISDMNGPATWTAGFPGFGGVASARGLAKFHGILAMGSGEVISERVLGEMETILTSGRDHVLCMPTAFSAGCQKDPLGDDDRKIRSHYGPSLRAFGHPGAGGSLAFADPEHRIGLGYVMNLIESGVMPNDRALSLVDAAYADL